MNSKAFIIQLVKGNYDELKRLTSQHTSICETQSIEAIITWYNLKSFAILIEASHLAYETKRTWFTMYDLQNFTRHEYQISWIVHVKIDSWIWKNQSYSFYFRIHTFQAYRIRIWFFDDYFLLR